MVSEFMLPPETFHTPTPLGRSQRLPVGQNEQQAEEILAHEQHTQDLQRLLDQLPSPNDPSQISFQLDHTNEVSPIQAHSNKEDHDNREHSIDMNQSHHVTIQLNEDDLKELDKELQVPLDEGLLQNDTMNMSDRYFKQADNSMMIEESCMAHPDSEDENEQGFRQSQAEKRQDPLGLFSPPQKQRAVLDNNSPSHSQQANHQPQQACSSSNTNQKPSAPINAEMTQQGQNTSSRVAFTSPPNTMAPPAAQFKMPKTPASKSSAAAVETTSAYSTPAAQLKSPSAAFPADYFSMLAEVRKECQHLRQMNQRLLQSNEEAQRAVEAALTDKNNAIGKIRAEYQKNLEMMEEACHRKVKQHETELETLRQEVTSLRSTQTQITSIREAIMKEKELDVMAVKKEILAQKEKQLHALRKEMMQEKAQLQQMFQKELERHETATSNLHDRLQHELESSHSTISLLRSQLGPPRSTVSSDTMTDEKIADLISIRDFQKMESHSGKLQETNLLLSAELQTARDAVENLRTESNERAEHFRNVLESKELVINELRKALAWRESTQDQDRAELNEAVQKVKQQCTKAYEAAISQLKSEYSNLEHRLKEKSEKEMTAYRHTLESKLRKEMDMEITDVTKLKKQVLDLTNEHRKVLREKEAALANEHSQALQKLKAQYIDTLRQMRDDVAASKQRSLERFKVEWERKKSSLDSEWQKKLNDVKAEYERKLAMPRSTKPTLSSVSKTQSRKPTRLAV